MKSLLVTLVVAILRALAPAAIDSARPKMHEADPMPSLRRKLTRCVRKVWVCLLVLALLSGCTRTVYVPDGTPVRLAETVKRVKVWVMVDGKPVRSVMDLPEGWYCLPVEEK